MVKNNFEIPAEKLKWTCSPEQFMFNNTSEVPPLEGTIGQERGVDAIDFGLNIKTQGFNIYVSGISGTGKTSTIKSYVERLAQTQKIPPDWCYVYNFSNPDTPLSINLPAGEGSIFVKDMEDFIETCKTEISRAFESEEYEKRRDKLTGKFKSQRDAILKELEEEAGQKGFAIQITPVGMVSVPAVDGKPMSSEEYEKLDEQKKKEIEEEGKKLETKMNQSLLKIKKIEKEMKEKICGLDRDIALFAIGHHLQEIKSKYKDYPKVSKFLEDAGNDIVNNAEEFRATAPKKELPFEIKIPSPEVSFFNRYKVNLIVDNSKTKGAPVIFEMNPTYYNLFGAIEYQVQMGAMLTDFTMIKSGAIHRANGGYLIVRVFDVLTNFLSWEALKRTLRSREARIENLGEQFRAYPTTTLKPEPIPIDVKVVLIGNPYIYYLLHAYDEEFEKLFKVKSDFDTRMDRTKEHINKYASFISARCKEENLKHFDKTGVAKVVEYGAWLAGDQEKLSTRFLEIADIVSESSFWTTKENSEYVSSEHVKKAIQEKIRRSNLIEEKIQEFIENGIIMIDTDGEVVGQVNGISIYEVGDYSFGKPSRITARAFVGRAGIVDIERETKMSGRIHTKGVMILSGYLGGKYGHNKPLSLSASLCFEQLYEEVEGDSASCAELCALLSSISEVSIKQGIAITGSVNQKGEIQPIGGVNQKIEGFFDVCKAKGLNGEQGVIIPHQNVRNLMLKDEVIQAVKDGKFHIYAIKNVDDAIEILTGMKAGKQDSRGNFEKGTFNYKVDMRLKELGKIYKESAEKEEPKKKEEE